MSTLTILAIILGVIIVLGILYCTVEVVTATLDGLCDIFGGLVDAFTGGE